MYKTPFAAATMIAAFLLSSLILSGIAHADQVDDKIRKAKECKDFESSDFIYNLRGINDPRIVEPLIQILKENPEESCRASAATELDWSMKYEYLKGRRDQRVFEAMIYTLQNDSSSQLRRMAADSLKEFNDRRAVPHLIKALSDSASIVRWFAVRSLASLASELREIPEAVDPLVRALEDPELRSDAGKALKALGLSKTGIRRKGGTPREKFQQLMEDLETDPFNREVKKQVIELLPSLKVPPKIPEEAERHMGRGMAAFKAARSLSDYKAAAKEFQKASALAPWWPDAYFNLALAEEKQRNFLGAMANLELYLQANPDAPDARAVRQKIHEINYLKEQSWKASEHREKGVKHYDAKRYEDAISEWKKALRLDPQNATTNSHLGSAYYELKRYKDAIPFLKEAIRLGEDDWGWNPYRLGNSYYEMKSYDDAIRAYKGSLRDVGQYLEVASYAYDSLGWAYEKKEQYKKALKYFELALKSGPPNEDDVRNSIRRVKRYLGR